MLFVVLLVFGKRVSYEQSIKSFFADDDPAMNQYQLAAKSFGDDNFVFVAYDDSALFTPAGMDRVSALAEAVGPNNVGGVVRVEALDTMPLLWKIDDTLLPVARAPAMARNFLMNAAKQAVRGIDLKKNAMTVGGAIRSTADPQAIAEIRQRVTHHPLFRGTVIDETGNTTAVVVRLKKTGDHDIMATVDALRRQADAFARKNGLGRPWIVGPPVLLADGFTSIEVDGRRLAVVGMVLIGIVTLSAVRSLWWALVPILSGWVVWLATETVLSALNLEASAFQGVALVACKIIVLNDDARSEPPRNPLPRRAAGVNLTRGWRAPRRSAPWPRRSSGAR